ncbi:MAG: twin-arginine translocase TatA/TatE family subunit [Candidatus Contendobacter sp.]|nr:twin-arginine translocase TatA/TatE family subunit [Gammaproteobacteria bacterium]MCC8994268.1 twin-arginine translocase TatA/TatE family subunit [Candidatus Contendobacter sp.]
MRFSVWELLLILVIVLVLFGGTRLRNLGSDLGSAIRGFRDSMKEGAKGETAEEDPKKIESAAVQNHEAGATPSAIPDPLAKDRNKVG